MPLKFNIKTFMREINLKSRNLIHNQNDLLPTCPSKFKSTFDQVVMTFFPYYQSLTDTISIFNNLLSFFASAFISVFLAC